MVGLLLLAPYNDSLRLGQGFNTFLQEPRAQNAMTFSSGSTTPTTPSTMQSTTPSFPQSTTTTTTTTTAGVSQTISYSTRFVENLSDIVHSMNLSAGSTIHNGGRVDLSGDSGGLTIDPAKFMSADANLAVSVKVTNHTPTTTTAPDTARFNPLQLDKWTSEKFHAIYGDAFVSGFIEGGELHGLVSVQGLEASEKQRLVEMRLKSTINNNTTTTTTTEVVAEFQGSVGNSAENLESALCNSETSVSVYSTGGGIVKRSEVEWTIAELFEAAAAFPERVGHTWQRTHVILTRYDQNLDFVAWAEEKGIQLRCYDMARRYAADLLDMYMQYQNNLSIVQRALSSMPGLSASFNVLVLRRQWMKAQMAKIVDNIATLNKHPELAHALETSNDIVPPEAWTPQLPRERLPATVATATTTTATTTTPPTQHNHQWEGTDVIDSDVAVATLVHQDLEQQLTAATLASASAAEESRAAQLLVDQASASWDGHKREAVEEKQRLQVADEKACSAARQVVTVRLERVQATEQHQRLLQKAIDRAASDLKQVQDERKKAEDRWVEDERRRAEDERKQAQAERKQAEDERKQAEEERKQAQAEREAALTRVHDHEPPQPLQSLAVNGTQQMNSEELAFCSDVGNIQKYRNYRLAFGMGSKVGGSPIEPHCVALESAALPVPWPKQLMFCLGNWNSKRLLGMGKVVYDGLELELGGPWYSGGEELIFDIDADAGERVVAVSVMLDLVTDPNAWTVTKCQAVPKWVQVTTSLGRRASCGERSSGGEDITWTCPADLLNGGLKGWHGRCGGIIDRIGPIWGN